MLEDQVAGDRRPARRGGRGAVHYHEASHPEAAFGWDLRAAEAAKQVGGVAEAVGCYRRMLAAWDDVADAGQQAGFDRVELLIRLAQAEELAGDISSVRTHLQDAVSWWIPPPNLCGLPCCRFACADRALHISGQPATALSLAAAAVKLVPESPPSLARVGVLANLGGLEYIFGPRRPRPRPRPRQLRPPRTGPGSESGGLGDAQLRSACGLADRASRRSGTGTPGTLAQPGRQVPGARR